MNPRENLARKTPADEIPSREELVARAKALVPFLKANAAATEARRSLLPEVVEKLFSEGLMRYFTPRRYGGYEADWGIQYYISKELAHGCPSTAWVSSVVGQHTMHASRFPKEAQDEVFADGPDLIIATSSGAKGATAEKVPGGYRISGAYGFSSGIDHSKWGMAFGMMENNPAKRIYFLLPRHEYEVGDVWHTIGMRGTGTKDIVVKDKFVPDHRALPMAVFASAHAPGSKVNPGYIYAMEFGPHIAGTSPLGPIVGAAEAALEAYIDITKKRVSAIDGAKIGDSELIHLRLAESASEVHAADMIARHDLDFLHRKGKAGELLTDGEKFELQRNRGFIGELCMRSTQRLIRMMGAMGIFDENPVNRYFRDIHAMTTQVGVAIDVTMPPWGRWALGLPQKGYMAAMKKATDEATASALGKKPD